MAGLLDFLNSPEAQLGIGLLAYSGDMGRPMGFGERIAGALGTVQRQQQAAEEKKLRAGLLEAQLGELQSKAAQRERMQGMLGGIFGAPTTSMGGGSNVPPEAAASGPASGGQGLRGVPLERIAALKAAGGPDLVEAWKLANVPTAMPAGNYALLPGQAPQYMADPSKGLGIGPQGVYALPGAAEAQAALAGAQEAAVQRARAGFDLVNIKGPQGETIAVPRSQVLGSAAPSGAPAGFATEGQMRAGMAQPMSGNAGQYDRDIADIQKALATPGLDASSRQLLQQELANRTEQRGRYFGGAPAAPATAGNVVELSPLQQAQNEAQRERIVGQAKADVTRDTEAQKAGKDANKFLTVAQQAMGLLSQNPTSSLAGAARDKVANAIGMSTAPGDVAGSLEAVSGWLVSNVPRMEGPQSNFDVENYRTMAGRVGDRTLPISTRKAALETVMQLQNKYSHLNAGEAAPEKPAQQSFQQRGYQSADAAIRDAQNAIMRGADRSKVEARLREMGLALPSGAQGSW